MKLSLRYMYHKIKAIDMEASIVDERIGPLKIQWIGVASTRFASHDGFLYFVTSKDEVPAPLARNSGMFGCVVRESLSSACKGIPRVVVSDSCDMDKLFDYLVREMDRYRNWHDTISDLLVADASYQELVDEMARFIPRPLYIADDCWRMIARVDFEMPEISATWHYQTLHDGLYPLNIVETLNRTGEYHRISTLPRAALLRSPAFTIPIVAKPIRYQGRLVGYFFIVDTWGDIGMCEVEVAQEFGKMLAPILAARGSKQGSIGGFQDNFITQIIDRLLTSKREIARQLKSETNWNVESDFRLVTVQFKPDEYDNHLLHMRTMGLLGGDYDHHAYFYKDMATVIFRNADEDTAQFIDHLKKSSVALKRIIVVSDRFRDFSQLAKYYEQSLNVHMRAERIGDETPRVIACDSSFPRILANLCQDSLPYSYEVDTLHHYDLKHGTTYCNTLLEYLKHERNAVATAEALFVHRNTLRNHLTKIGEIISMDFDDADIRFRILVSLNTLLKASSGTYSLSDADNEAEQEGEGAAA